MIFQNVQTSKPKGNAFNLSHDRKFSFNMGTLIPVFCEDAIPGDKFKVSTETLLRFAPMISPVMHDIDCTVHYFAVPMRLLWEDWEDFITGGEDGKDESVAPYIGQGQRQDLMSKSTLADYIGYGIGGNQGVGSHARATLFAARAYQLIVKEYYRDQNLEEKPETYMGGGQILDDVELDETFKLHVRSQTKDYFTSSLPFAQKGEPVEIGLGTTAQIQKTDPLKGDFEDNLPAESEAKFQGENIGTYDNSTPPNFNQNPLNITNLEVDLSEATGITINELRNAIKLQEWLEKNARGGSRYVESILNHFGVRSSDARLQRPQFLGGGKTPVVISEVLQTSTSQGETAQGNMAGHGISVGRTANFSEFFEEHTIVMGIMSVMPKPSYQQGQRKQFWKQSKFDYYWPEFAHLGEQEVTNQEIFASSGTGLFGYQERYAEYKSVNSSVHGDFRDNLSQWHLGNIYGDGTPLLNADFIKYDSDRAERIFAVQNEPDTPEEEKIHHLYCQMYHRFTAIRPMPVFGTPTL